MEKSRMVMDMLKKAIVFFPFKTVALLLWRFNPYGYTMASKGRRNWRDFFSILGISFVYLVLGLCISIGSLVISANDGYHWMIWIYRIVGPLTMSMLLLCVLFSFQVLNVDR